MPQNIFAPLEHHLKAVKLAFGDVIAESERPVERVYFPHSGVVSLVVEMEVGDMIETAMVGRDGVVNGTSALDGKMSMHKAVVQVGGEGSAISSDTLRSIANEFEPFRSVLIRHEQIVLAQAQQSAACNASHTVESRMCRWLLRIRDLTQSNEMELTQEFWGKCLACGAQASRWSRGTCRNQASSDIGAAIFNSWTLRRFKAARASATNACGPTTSGFSLAGSDGAFA